VKKREQQQNRRSLTYVGQGSGEEEAETNCFRFAPGELYDHQGGIFINPFLNFNNIIKIGCYSFANRHMRQLGLYEELNASECFWRPGSARLPGWSLNTLLNSSRSKKAGD